MIGWLASDQDFFNLLRENKYESGRQEDVRDSDAGCLRDYRGHHSVVLPNTGPDGSRPSPVLPNTGPDGSRPPHQLTGKVMAITLSHGGPTIYRSPARSRHVLVGTIQGVVCMERDAHGPGWHVAHRTLTD